MNLIRRKNVIGLCGNEGCHHLATHFFKLKINGEDEYRIGLCKSCSFDLQILGIMTIGGDLYERTN